MNCLAENKTKQRGTVPFGKKRENNMQNINTYTAVTKQDGNWCIGWVEEVPGVNCQERTKKDLLKSIRVTLKEALELNREDAER